MKSEKKDHKLIIGIIVAVVVCAVVGFGLWSYFGRKNQPAGDVADAASTAVDLNELEEDYTVTQAGTYVLHGQTTHSVKVNAPDAEVTLVLNDVQIQQPETAAIIGQAANKLTIELADQSENYLSDGGSSEYDACIFSNADLYFTGDGQLTVIGQQEEGEGIATESKDMTFDGNGIYYITSADDGLNAGGNGGTITINGGNFYIDASGDGIDSNQNAVINGGSIFVMGSDIGGDAGIDTDDGYTINGGSVLALGSDMLETPLEGSAQTTLSFSLDQAIAAGTTVTLRRDGVDVLSFQAGKSFRTIIYSDPSLTAGTYTLSYGGEHDGTLIRGVYYNGEYVGGEVLTVDGATEFTVTDGLNNFGRSMTGGPGGTPPALPGGEAPNRPGASGTVPPEPR